MTPRLASDIGLVMLWSAIAVLLFSAWRSVQGTPSVGVAILGSALLVMAIGVRMMARKASAS